MAKNIESLLNDNFCSEYTILRSPYSDSYIFRYYKHHYPEGPIFASLEMPERVLMLTNIDPVDLIKYYQGKLNYMVLDYLYRHHGNGD